MENKISDHHYMKLLYHLPLAFKSTAGKWQQKHAGADPGDPEILQRNVTSQISGLEQLSCEGTQK